MSGGHDIESTTAIVLAGVAVMILLGALAGGLMTRWRQPAVIGEILVGIALGPSLLGLIPGDPQESLFPDHARPFLSVLAQVGIVLFMFTIGFELDSHELRRAGPSAATVSICSIILPFSGGFALAFLLHPWHDRVGGENVDFLAFALFMGAAMSITAFPVLARILTALGLQKGRLGSFVLACAATDDVIAWSVLTLVVAITEGGSPWDAGEMIGGVLLYVAALIVIVRPILRHLLLSTWVRQAKAGAPYIILVSGTFLSAWVTTQLGLHPIFGAFLFGAIAPHDVIRRVSPGTPYLIEQTSYLLVPVFFIVTGLKVDLGALDARGGMEIVLVLLVACLGKFIGAGVTARFCGMDGRRAAAVGVLMNSRGLTELIVINMGVSLGVLDPELATIMIIMAVVTTMMTAPLFHVVYPEHMRRIDAPPRRVPAASSDGDGQVAAEARPSG